MTSRSDSQLTIGVTGAGSLIGQGLIKALKLSNMPCRLVGFDYFAHAVGLYWCDQAYMLPDVLRADVDEAVFIEKLCDVLSRERVDVLLVGTDFEVPLLAAHRESVERRSACRIVVSSPQVAAISDDKWETVQFLAGRGFPHPASLIDLSLLDEFVKTVGFPLIVKPRRGARSRGVSLTHSIAELHAAVATIEDPIVQQAIGSADAEFTCGAVVFDEQCLGTIVMRRDLRDGNTYRAFVGAHPEIEKYVARVAEALDPFGPANFQLRLGAEGPIIFEINARFSGSTIIRALSGFNEVDAVVRAVARGERPRIARCRDAVVLRYWEEQVLSPAAYAQLQSVGCS